MQKAIATYATAVWPGLKTRKKKKEISYILLQISETSIHPSEVCLSWPSCLNKTYSKKLNETVGMLKTFTHGRPLLVTIHKEKKKKRARGKCSRLNHVLVLLSFTCS